MPAEAKRSKKSKGKILIVDDEKMICESLNLLLSRRSIDAISTYSGESAIKAVKADSIDLVILDYSLPDIDGLEVLAAIRKINKDLPVIFMTGYGSETISIKAFRLGTVDYFIKPFHPQKLVNRTLEILKDNRSILTAKSQNLPGVEIDRELEDSSGIGIAVQYLKENFRSRITLEDISKKAGISRYHFARTFKKVMGMPFSDYLNHLRVKKAEEGLSNLEANITQVAFSAGFNSLRQFERTFKNVLGKSPQEFRKERFLNSSS